jgi:DNA (cytosine-5)-methyltransferase 1
MQRSDGKMRGDRLDYATERTEDGESTGGQLNPDWVEALMSWPVGWTSLEPLSREAFDHWQSNPKWQDWEPDIPRVGKSIKNRASRLKAIGNGQVPIVVATAWRLLTQNHKEAI